MADLSPAQANEASLWFAVFLVVLLALSLAAVVVSPPQHGSRAEQGDGDSGAPGRPQRGGPPWGPAPKPPLPRRVAGQSGAAPPGMTHPGGPPWGPAAKPPGVP